MSIKDITKDINKNHYFNHEIKTKSIYNAMYREWSKDNYVFYADDKYTRPKMYNVDPKYYKPNDRLIGP